MGGELVRDARNGPLCPYAAGPVQSLAHDLKNRLHDARYRAQAGLRDDEGELPEDLDAVEAKAYEALNDSMRLFAASDVGSVGGRFERFEAFYWQCQVCGFVLPAQVRRD